MIIHPESHLDHDLTLQIVRYLLAFHPSVFPAGKLTIKTLTLPTELGEVLCGLHGPAMGDPPVPAEETWIGARAGRQWASRLVEREARKTPLLTVITSPHDGYPCVLASAFGGPQAPREPGDPSLYIQGTIAEQTASREFWNAHALTGSR